MQRNSVHDLKVLRKLEIIYVQGFMNGLGREEENSLRKELLNRQELEQIFKGFTTTTTSSRFTLKRKQSSATSLELLLKSLRHLER